jgi:hypothetical protein
MPSTTESGGSSRALLAGAGLFGLWLGRKLGVRKGKRIAAKKVAKAEQKGRRD